MFDRFRRPKPRTGAEAEEVKALTDQFFVTLRSYAAALPPVQEAQPRSPGRKKIEQLLNKPISEQTWSDAYQVEQLLVHEFAPSTVAQELQRRILEARTALRPEIARYYQATGAAATDVENKRVLLLRLVNDLQWRYTVQEVGRAYNKEITRNVSHFFVGALGLILIAVIAMTLWPYLAPETLSGDVSDPVGWLATVLMAGVAGGWGAMFSVLTGLRQRLDESSFDDLKLTRSTAVLLTRPLIGVGAALILFFFLESELLAGEAFPSLDEHASPRGKELALLLVWCFIAGFSEKLVPNLLARTERRASEEPPADPGNPRPPAQPQDAEQQEEQTPEGK